MLVNSTAFSKAFRFFCPRRCPLRGKVRVVADMEPEEAEQIDVLFLGVNPGAKEADLGRPFVGPAGKLLRRTAREILAGHVLAFSNVILCSTSKESDISDANQAIECCAENVASIWQVLQPKIYVPCGAKALSKFTITDKIMAVSGRVYHLDGLTVVPMLHPAAVLRGCGSREMLADAMRTIKRLLRH
ncbi:MAG: uracil-DNA glycosylase family protein [Desulfovibrio sp.]|nr:uracil-DNA glycosylase family protein [Desulfovibrio sp.]